MAVLLTNENVISQEATNNIINLKNVNPAK